MKATETEPRLRTTDVLHKRIISTIITRLDKRRAAYFGRVVDRLEQDPRTELYPNLPILVLKETVEILPTYIEPKVLVDHLFRFLQEEKDTLSRIIHSAHYVSNNAVLTPYCKAFVEDVIRDTLATVDVAEQNNEGRSEYRLGWPIAPTDFPYSDDETGNEGGL